MKGKLLAAVAILLSFSPVLAAPYGDVMTPISQFIEGFNTGDTNSAFAAYASGDIFIIDEFAPHRWFGPNAAHDWAAAWERHSQATGVSDAVVKFGMPTRTQIEGDAAYVIVPTIYLYKEHGTAMKEEGEMTFVLRGEAAGWKICAWVWSGVKPHPAG